MSAVSAPSPAPALRWRGLDLARSPAALAAAPAGSAAGPALPEPSDEILMQSYAAGDAAAFETLYRRHRNTLYGFLLRALGRRDQADDCFQEVWSRVINAAPRYRPEAKFSTWLLQIAHNLLIDRHRRQRPEQPLDTADGDGPVIAALVEHEATPERQLSEFQAQQRLRQAIAALPAEQRHVVLLRLDQELSLEEIGLITGVGRETVKSRLRYAMDKLRERLA
jgi:RNA polymerase sigma-70 factor (ECF subfamily)